MRDFARAQEIPREVAKRRVDHWFAAAEPHAEEAYLRAANRFVELANGFLNRLGDSGDAASSAPPTAVSPEIGFRSRSRLYFTDLMHLTGVSPLRWLVERLSPAEAFLRLVEREIGEYLGHLVSTNAMRVESDFGERVLESRRRLGREIRSRLSERGLRCGRAGARTRPGTARGGRRGGGRGSRGCSNG